MSNAQKSLSGLWGAQGTGKSTFARLLVNALMSRGAKAVAYLDVDCGQPELTVPGDTLQRIPAKFSRAVRGLCHSNPLQVECAHGKRLLQDLIVSHMIGSFLPAIARMTHMACARADCIRP